MDGGEKAVNENAEGDTEEGGGERERLTGNLHLGSALEKGVGEPQVEKIRTHQSHEMGREGERE